MLICANINLLGFLSLISCRSLRLCVKELGLSEFRRLQDVFKTFARRLQDVFKTSSRRVCKTYFSRRLAIMSWRRLQRRLEDVLESKNMLHWRRLQYEDVFKASSEHVHQDECLLVKNTPVATTESRRVFLCNLWSITPYRSHL